jgi:linoleoyl-CoA desaturase
MHSLAVLRHEIGARGFGRRPTARIIGELCLHLGITACGIAFFLAGRGILLCTAGLLLCSAGSLGVATNCHSASHHATSRSRWLDRALTYFGFPFFLLVSSEWWRRRHLSVHHPRPNVLGIDDDIDFGDWLQYTQADPPGRLGLTRRSRTLRCCAAVLIPGLLLLHLQQKSWRHLWSQICLGPAAKRQAAIVDLLGLILGVTFWLVLPLFFLPPWEVLLFLAVRNVLLSFGLFAAFAPAHWPEEAAALSMELRDEDPVRILTAATIDFRAGTLAGLFLSGLDHHIEHHLFPEISYVHYPALSRLVESYCLRHGYPYRRLSWGEAILKSIRNLFRPKEVIRRRDELAAFALPLPRTGVLGLGLGRPLPQENDALDSI